MNYELKNKINRNSQSSFQILIGYNQFFFSGMNSSSDEPWCPSLDHIKTKDFQDVYDPVEDTYALSDAIQADRGLLNDTVKPKICVEVGSGSGYISAVLSHVLGGRALVLSTDVNTRAAQITAATMGANGAGGASGSVVCDLVGPLAERLRGSVDVLVFNPPYVPTDEEEYQLSVKTHDISAAWAGGPTGTAVLDRLIPHISVNSMKSMTFNVINCF